MKDIFAGKVQGKRNPRKKKISMEEAARAEQLVNAGATYTDIAENTDFGRQAMKNAVRNLRNKRKAENFKGSAAGAKKKGGAKKGGAKKGGAKKSASKGGMQTFDFVTMAGQTGSVQAPSRQQAQDMVLAQHRSLKSLKRAA